VRLENLAAAVLEMRALLILAEVVVVQEVLVHHITLVEMVAPVLLS
jgi:hypothetical protein